MKGFVMKKKLQLNFLFHSAYQACIGIIYAEFKARQPEPLNTRFENRRSKEDAVKLHFEKKNQRSHELYPPSEYLNTHLFLAATI